MKHVWILLAGLVAATALHAQSLPTGVTFTASTDHASSIVGGYRIYILSGTQQLRARDIGKPQPDGAGSITYHEPALFTGLAAGTYEIAATAYGSGGESVPSNKASFVVDDSSGGVPAPPSNTQPVFGDGGATVVFVEAEHFDEGGAGTAYFDTTPGNEGGVYRTTDVDLEVSGDDGGGHNVGWTTAGEWINYTVNVPAAGTYDIEVRVASLGAGGVFHIEVGGVDRTGPLTIPGTGGWQIWTTVRKSGVQLNAGTQTWRIVVDSHNPENGFAGNFNWLRAVPR